MYEPKGVFFGLVLPPRRKRSLAFTHSCEVTIYNRPPFLLPAVLRLGKIKTKRPLLITTFLHLLLLCVSRYFALKWNKRHSLASFFAFLLTSTGIRTFSMTVFTFLSDDFQLRPFPSAMPINFKLWDAAKPLKHSSKEIVNKRRDIQHFPHRIISKRV